MMDYKRLYKTWSGTIPAGGSVKISMGGFYIRFLESDATGLIAVNDGDPGVAVGGLGLSLPDGFENFRLTNPNGTDWTVTVGVSEGAIEDSRLNVPSGIDVNVASDTPGDAGRAAILAMMQNADDQRVGVNSLGQSNFMLNNISSSASVLIDPSLNTNGAILRWFRGFANTSSNHAVYIDTAAPSGPDDATKRRIHYTLGIAEHYQLKGLPLEIPSGHGLWVIGSTADSIRIEGGFDLL